MSAFIKTALAELTGVCCLERAGKGQIRGFPSRSDIRGTTCVRDTPAIL